MGLCQFYMLYVRRGQRTSNGAETSVFKKPIVTLGIIHTFSPKFTMKILASNKVNNCQTVWKLFSPQFFKNLKN